MIHGHKTSVHLKTAALLCVLTLSAASLPAQTASAPQTQATHVGDAELQKRLQRKLDDLHAKYNFPGITAAAVLPDGTLINASAGSADVERNIAMKPQDRILAGSIGKTFFAALFMRLASEHKLDLDQKISVWIGDEPWFHRLPNANDITFKMLLNHTSGIPEHVETPEFMKAVWKDPDKVWTPLETLAFTFDKPAKFPAGTGFSYADTNYILAGYIVEKITKRPLYGQVREQFLIPLELKDTDPSTNRVLCGLATGYSMPHSPFLVEGRMLENGKLPFNPQMEWTGGGFISTSSDLARWAKALYEGKAFDKSMLFVMENVVPANTGRDDQYGLGVQVRHTNYGTTYGHGGWYPGYMSEMEYFKDQHASISVQVNTDDRAKTKTSPHEYVVEIANVLFGE
jgi:D-alanyl-D-alanine carboxypeptidase